MPEAPEVELIARHLDAASRGALIMAAHGTGGRYDPTGAQGAVMGSTRRRGKYLITELTHAIAISRPKFSGHPSELIIHLGMAGQLTLDNPHPHAHRRATLVLDNGHILTLDDPRGFGGTLVVETGNYAAFPSLHHAGPDLLADLNPDARTATWERTQARLARGTRHVKTRLLDQRIVAGIGNYLVDETLHAARVHPAARTLDARKAGVLLTHAHRIACASLAAGGVSMRDYVHLDGSRGTYYDQLTVYGHADEPCPTCTRAILVKSRVDGRGTTWCPRCQPPPR